MSVRKMAVLLAIAGTALMGCNIFGGPKDAAEKAQARAEVDQMASQGLSRLYKLQPKAQEAVENSAGYAVFSTFGMKIFIAGSGWGKGIAVNRKTMDKTYMWMYEIQGGLGWSVKHFHLIWVFENEKLLNDFINSGWDFGAHASAAAQLEGKGASFEGAISVAPGVWLYQVTDSGVALELTLKGTKIMKDDKLN